MITLNKNKSNPFLSVLLLMIAAFEVLLIFNFGAQTFAPVSEVEDSALVVTRSYVIDKQNHITAQNVLSKERLFEMMATDVTDFGTETAPIWIKFEIENTSSTAQKRTLDTGNNLPQQANIYTVSASKQLQLIYQHEYPRIQVINYITPNVATQLQIAPHERMTLFIQYQSIASNHLHLALLKNDAALSNHFLLVAAALCAVTIMFTLIIFSFIVYWVLGQKKYLYFGCQELSASLIILNAGGILFLLSPQDDVAFVGVLSVGLSFVTSFFAQLFGVAFLTSIKPLPYFSKASFFIRALLLVLFILLLVPATRAVAIACGQPLILLSAVSLVMASGYLAVKGHKESWPYLLSWVGVLTAVAYFVLVHNDIIKDETTFHYMAVYVSIAMQSLLMSLSLWLQMSRMGKAAGEQREELMGVYHERAKEAEQVALLSSQRNEAMQDAFDKTRNLVSVSHDINNYIAVIKHSLNGAANTKDAPVEQAMDSLDHLKELSSQIITLNQFGQCSAAELCDIEKLISTLQQEYQPAAAEKRITLRFSCRVKSLDISEVLIKRIFDNLLQNAIKFTQDSPVYIAVWQEANAIVLQVMDSGKGMPEKEIDRLMLAFQQEKTATEGFGLGLFIVKSLSNSVGAELSIKRNRRAGMNIKVKIPLSRESNFTSQ